MAIALSYSLMLPFPKIGTSLIYKLQRYAVVDIIKDEKGRDKGVIFETCCPHCWGKHKVYMAEGGSNLRRRCPKCVQKMKKLNNKLLFHLGSGFVSGNIP
jgi:hypothetical protein